MKKGDKIRIIRMDDCGGKDFIVRKMDGIEGVISFIDDMGHIHLEGYSLSLIPNVDDYEVIEQ